MFAAHRKARIDLLAGSRIARAGIDGAHRRYLWRGEAIRRVGILALENSRIETTGWRVVDDAVLDCVTGITGSQHRLRISANFGAEITLAGSFIVELPLHSDITISGTIWLAGANAEIPS